MEVGEFVSKIIDKGFGWIDILTVTYTVRITLIALLFLTLCYNFIYRRHEGGMRTLYAVGFVLLSFIIGYAIPLEWLEEVKRPGGVFVLSLFFLTGIIYVLPHTLSGIPLEQKKLRVSIAIIVGFFIVVQLVLGFWS